MRSALLLLALAQQMVADDFESGGLASWSTAATGSPMLSVTSGAAHRGDAGLHIDLPSPVAAGSDSAYVAFFPNPPYAGPDLFLRFWVRHSLAGPAAMVPIATIGGNQNLQLSLSIPATDGGVGGWFLDEVYVLGLGTDAGQIVLYSNGVQTAQAPFDFTGWTLNQIQVGLVAAGTGGYQGSIDYDDVRTSTTAPAAQLGFDAGIPRVGSCVPLKFSLLSSTHVVTPTPHDSFIEVPPQVGLLYGDAACSMPAATATIAQGMAIGFAWVVPQSAGPLSAVLLADDYVGARISGNIGPPIADAGVSDAGMDGGFDGGEDAGEPDAGIDAGAADAGGDGGDPDAGPLVPTTLQVGCGCTAGEGPAVVLLLTALLRIHRRRRRPCAPRRGAWLPSRSP